VYTSPEADRELRVVVSDIRSQKIDDEGLRTAVSKLFPSPVQGKQKVSTTPCNSQAVSDEEAFSG